MNTLTFVDSQYEKEIVAVEFMIHFIAPHDVLNLANAEPTRGPLFGSTNIANRNFFHVVKIMKREKATELFL
jgi:hypothetical protein